MANKYNITEDARIWHVGDIDPEDFIDVLYELKQGEEWYVRLRENGVYLDDIPAEGAVTKLIKMIFGASAVQKVWKSVESHESPEEFWMRYTKEVALSAKGETGYGTGEVPEKEKEAVPCDKTGLE